MAATIRTPTHSEVISKLILYSDKEADRQKGKQTDRQTDRQTKR